MSRSDVRWAVILTVILVLVFAVAGTAIAAKGGNKPPDPGGGGGHTETATNNLSFPVIAVDAFSITALTLPSFNVEYAGLYPGLTAEEIAALGTGPWYAQKTTGNVWQAEFLPETHANVTCVDWSDSMESVYPKPGNPFRLEVVLYKNLIADDIDTGLAIGTKTGYRMAVLEYPSSKNELQGTNTVTYPSDYATVVSSQPKLVVQYLGASVPDPDLTWSTTLSKWTLDGTVPRVDPVSFAVELNVGGKYIFGASKKGWVPASEGFYRVTFYAPALSQVDLRTAITGDAAAGYLPGTGSAAFGQIDNINNLAYIDLEVGGVSDPGGDD